MRLIASLLLIVAVFGGLGLIVLWLPVRRERKLANRSQMIKDENYLALERSVNLWERVLEADDYVPSLSKKHKDEAQEIIKSFNNRQLGR